jgi:hypothetical protein
MYVNEKMIPVETIPVMGAGGIKENDGWIQILYMVRTFANVTIYPQYNSNNKKLKMKYVI